MSPIVDSIKDNVASTSISYGQHLAAFLKSAGTPVEIKNRPTPSPGPNELLIEARSIALNPIDHKQRDFGLTIRSYPTILGSDVAGVVLSIGSDVSSELFKPGMRVAAYALGFYKNNDMDYGSFQKRVLVPSANVVSLPEQISFNEAALLPMSVTTAWNGCYILGISHDTAYKPVDKQGMLVWGGASSMGTGAIQIAKSLGFTVYATASEKHHENLEGLGISRTFDYRNKNVVELVV